MKHVRTYGAAPFTVVVVHGGPGAPGTMAPVARELATDWGVVETLHAARSIEGQLAELRLAVTSVAQPPVAIVGHSWGAMLGYLFAAREPGLVSKLILVGSGVFEDRYAAGIDETRLSRMSEVARDEVRTLTAALQDSARQDKGAIFARLGELFARADAYDPLPHAPADLAAQYEVFQHVWPEAQALRTGGTLVQVGRGIQCPVVAIHGDYDPHPVEGIQEPLAATLRGFRLILLSHCGHEPWIEREARDAFYRALYEELSS
jgi:pimeloyl-ACP methyl ester carboxylesterase